MVFLVWIPSHLCQTPKTRFLRLCADFHPVKGFPRRDFATSRFLKPILASLMRPVEAGPFFCLMSGLRWLSSATCYGLQATPDVSGLYQNPLAAIPLPGSHVHRKCVTFFMVALAFCVFPRLSPIPAASFSPFQVQHDDVSLMTLLSIHSSRCHPTAYSGLQATPISSDEIESPGLPTRTRLLIWSHSSEEECLFT